MDLLGLVHGILNHDLRPFAKHRLGASGLAQGPVGVAALDVLSAVAVILGQAGVVVEDGRMVAGSAESALGDDQSPGRHQLVKGQSLAAEVVLVRVALVATGSGKQVYGFIRVEWTVDVGVEFPECRLVRNDATNFA